MRTAWLAVGPDRQAWVAGDRGLIRVTAKGKVKQPQSGLSSAIRGLVVTETDTLVLDGAGLSRVVGDYFEQIWAEPIHSAWTVQQLLAVSEDEVLAFTLDAGSAVWHPYADGSWAPTAWPSEYDCNAVLSDDGAIWLGTPDGLTRIVDGQTEVMVKVQGCPVHGQGAGVPGGSGWRGAGVVPHRPLP